MSIDFCKANLMNVEEWGTAEKHQDGATAEPTNERPRQPTLVNQFSLAFC